MLNEFDSLIFPLNLPSIINTELIKNCEAPLQTPLSNNNCYVSTPAEDKQNDKFTMKGKNDNVLKMSQLSSNQ